MRIRLTGVFLLSFVFGVASICNAQHIRIANDGAIPNGGMTPPTILKSTVVLYTDQARSRNVEGTVTLEALVDESGKVRAARVLRSLGYGLDDVARSAVAQWTISPATRNGVPVLGGVIPGRTRSAFALRSLKSTSM